MTRLITQAATVAHLVLFSGCETSTTAPPPEPPKPTVSFASQIQPIFDTHCIRCHVTGGFANNSGIPLRLIGSVSYNLLVSRSSVQRTDLMLVSPGNPDASLLYLKISSSNPPVGRQMPWDRGTTLTAEEIELVRTWISEGAANN